MYQARVRYQSSRSQNENVPFLAKSGSEIRKTRYAAVPARKKGDLNWKLKLVNIISSHTNWSVPPRVRAFLVLCYLCKLITVYVNLLYLCSCVLAIVQLTYQPNVSRMLSLKTFSHRIYFIALLQD